MGKKKKKKKNKNKVDSNDDRFTGNAGANTERDYALFGEFWDGVTQNTISDKIVFADGETEKTLQFTIRGDNKYDGTRSVVWTVDPSSSFGFDKEFYIFNEAIAGDPNSNPSSSDDPNERFINSEPQDITLVLDSPIKAVTILIEEDELPDRIIRGTDNKDKLKVPKNDFVDAENRTPASQYGYAVHGYDGNDTLKGANGIDDLFGWDGKDTLYGKESSDYLAGNSGNDSLYGEDLDEKETSNVGGDLLDGGSGDDFAFGGPGVDKIFGWTGDDVLRGGLETDQSSDLLYGEYGDDQLYGGGGKDALFGGYDNDRFEFYNPDVDGWDYIADFDRSEDHVGIYVGKGIKGAKVFRKSDLKFKKDGTLKSKHFVSFNEERQRDIKPTDNDDRFLYNQFSGKLYFDQDGKRHVFRKQLIAVFADPIIPEGPGWQETDQVSEAIIDPDPEDLTYPKIAAKDIIGFEDSDINIIGGDELAVFDGGNTF